MMTFKKTYLLFLFVIPFFCGSYSYAQNYKKIDSLIKATSVKIYQNPDEVIAIGNKIVSNSGDDVNIKIKGYKLISDAYSSKRDYQKSLEYVIKANDLLNQTTNKLLKISIIVKAGIQYHQLKIYDKSIQFLDQSEKMCLEYPVRDSVNVYLGSNYIVRGFIYKEKLNCDIAIAYFEKGIKEIAMSKIDPNSSFTKISIAKYNIGNCYILMSENELAIKNFTESINYAKKFNSVSLQAFALKGLAQVYTLQSKYQLAIEQLNEAQKISADVNDLVLNQEIYKGLAENYLALNDWDKYKNYHLEYLKTQSELKESERKSISNLIIEKDKQVTKSINSDFSNFIFWFLSSITAITLIIYILSIQKTKAVIDDLKKKIEVLQNDELKQ